MVVSEPILRKCLMSILLFFMTGTLAFSEIKTIGTPFIRNYSKHEYRAGAQNWAIRQDQNGCLYFANNEGLLVFDGVRWELFRMPNNSMVRSVFIDKNGKIYIGAYNDFGLMESDIDGKMSFISLKTHLPSEYQNFDDVWSTMSFQDGIVFQSYKAAYIFKKDNTCDVLSAPSRFIGSFSVRDRLILNDVTSGLSEYDGETLTSLPGTEALRGEEIRSVLPFGDSSSFLICTSNKGLFIYNGVKLQQWTIGVNDMLKSKQIFSAITLKNNYFAFGTVQDGVIIIDDSGLLIQHINTRNGLQNSTILNLFCDRAGDMWLALDNGIDYVNINSPLTFIQNHDGFGSGYTTLIFRDKIYLGTNQGLFVNDWNGTGSGGDYRLIPGTSGQVWYLGIHNDVIVCGHNKGTFIIDGERAEQINDIPGGWKYHILRSHPDYMIGGTYSGLILFRWVNSKWEFLRELKGFGESFRVFEEDEKGNLWMSHGLKGIFKVCLNETLDSVKSYHYYNESDGLPVTYNMNLFKVNGKLIFTTLSNGFYEYQEQTDHFVPDLFLNQLFKTMKGASLLKEDNAGNLWYISDDRLGFFQPEDDMTYRQVVSPFELLDGRFINGFESVYCNSEKDIFIGIEDGFAHYSPRNSFVTDNDFSAHITQAVALYPDSVFYYGNNFHPKGEKKTYHFPYRRNGIGFTYTSPVYCCQGNIMYSYFMKGISDNWSPWSTSTSQEFSHLPEGEYEFIVKARDTMGNESSSDSLMIVIHPPWHRSVMAYVIYFILSFLVAVTLIRTVRRRIEVVNNKERLRQIKEYSDREQEYERQALQAESEIINMKNENLRIQMVQRNKELANQAMNLVRKNEFLGKIRNDINKIKERSADKTVSEMADSIIVEINKDIDHNTQKEVFEKAFDEVHELFLEKLKRRYPNLTPAEQRMCAYLKMNISTKEIAPLMNISVRGVEICRYRIRKKMGLTRDVNLTSLLIDL